LNNLQALTK